ncbi:hypothetical protein M758_10G048300 [Ceratodon purpureus]|nr:hypothetical protein M758_10G048300 [Ceratodon purpureus]
MMKRGVALSRGNYTKPITQRRLLLPKLRHPHHSTALLHQHTCTLLPCSCSCPLTQAIAVLLPGFSQLNVILF